MTNVLFWVKSTIGNSSITWYAVFILIGVCIGFVYLIREGKRIGIASDDIYTGTIIGLPCGIIGARAWYILFNLDQGWTFRSVIGLEGGLSGLAIQGGVIGASLSLLIFCLVKKISIYKIFDIAAPAILMAQIFGRIGNFCNHELWGPVIENENYAKFIYSIPLLGENMCFSNSGTSVTQQYSYIYVHHPVCLYEQLFNILGVGILLEHKKFSRHLHSGDMVGMYLCWYGMVRIPCELIREASGAGEILTLGSTGIPVSIVTSVLFIVLGAAFLIIKRFVGPQETYQHVVETVKANKFDLIIFDNDGTLLDTKNLIFQSFIYTFEKFRPELKLSEEELESFFGPTLKESFSRYSEDEKEVEEMIAYYRAYNQANHDAMVKAFPGVKETLRTLHKKHYKLAVVSSKQSKLVNHGLEITGLLPYFDLVIGEDEVKAHKPDPEGILMAVEKLEGKHAAYVGDTKADIEAARNANVTAIGVLYISHPEIMLDAKPDYVLSKMDELLKICVE